MVTMARMMVRTTMMEKLTMMGVMLMPMKMLIDMLATTGDFQVNQHRGDDR